MDLKHLEYFSVVAQCGSMNKASQVLYVSQPHLSHIIKDIEDEVGTRLLVRIPTGVALTPDGERFLRNSRTVLEEAAALRAMFRTPKEEKPAFHVAMTKSSHVMESFIDVCQQHERNGKSFSYILDEGAPMDVIRSVVSGASQVGVLHFNAAHREQYQALWKENKLTYHRLAIYLPHIVLRRGHPLIESGEAITPKALCQYGFVRYIGSHEDSIYSLTVDGVEYNLGQSLQVAHVYGRASLLHLIAATNFYTIGIRDFDCQQRAYNVVAMPIPNCESELEFGYILPKAYNPSDAVECLLECLRHRLH